MARTMQSLPRRLARMWDKLVVQHDRLAELYFELLRVRAFFSFAV